MSVALENVTHVYQQGGPWETTALYDVTLDIPADQSVGIIGATGSGKSTLIQHFNGLLRPTAGRVLVDGHDLWSPGADHRRLRLQVGMVFQHPEQQLFEETVLADVMFGPLNLGLTHDEARQKARAALKQVGIAEDLHHRSPFELSGGQQRRVAIAGVLAMEPKMLVLDEPTAGLDPRGSRQILDMLQRLRQQRRLSLVVVSHNMDQLARLVERVVVLQAGRVVADDAALDVFAAYRKLEEAGLAAPVTVQLVAALQQRGWPLTPRTLLPAAVADEIAAAMRGNPHV